MTQNIAEIELWEATPDEDEMFEIEAAEYAASVKAALQVYYDYCQRADNGEQCISCHYRPMATDNDLGYGFGMCSSCTDLGNEFASYGRY